MGISKSTQFDRFDRSTFIQNKKSHLSPTSSTVNDNLREKHLPEYPPLIIYKDSQCQTTESTLIQGSSSHKSLHTIPIFTLKHGIVALIAYLFICFLACSSLSFQTGMIYMNWVNFPFTNLSDLPSYGLVNARNMEYITEDAVVIKGWHLLPPGKITWESLKIKNNKEKELYYNQQLRTTDKIIIQLHGNAANRGVPRRIELMKQLASEFNSHVIAIDYRGFGDSTGIPSEIGTTKDMFGLWKWLETILIPEGNEVYLNSTIKRKLPSIIIYSLSLGTGIAVDFLHHLSLQQNHDLLSSSAAGAGPGPGGGGAEGGDVDLFVPLSNYTPSLSLYPVGLILNSPFSSISDAIHDYPYSMIFRLIPFVFNILSKFIKYQYPTIENIQNIRCPILILHGTDDTTIPLLHSKRIMKSFENSHHEIPSICDISSLNSTNNLCLNENMTSSSSPAPAPSTCSLRVRAVENGDLYSGMDCISSSSSSSSSSSLPIISLVEFPHGTHENIYRRPEWFLVLSDFIDKCVNRQ